jgi:hypothetical protein
VVSAAVNNGLSPILVCGIIILIGLIPLSLSKETFNIIKKE